MGGTSAAGRVNDDGAPSPAPVAEFKLIAAVGLERDSSELWQTSPRPVEEVVVAKVTG
jgi:hypothetical protein